MTFPAGFVLTPEGSAIVPARRDGWSAVGPAFQPVFGSGERSATRGIGRHAEIAPAGAKESLVFARFLAPPPHPGRKDTTTSLPRVALRRATARLRTTRGYGRTPRLGEKLAA